MTPASKSTFVLGHRHLLGIEGLSAADITGLLDLSEEYVELNRQVDKKRTSLRGRTQVNLFFEASTRTQSSFELAGKRLGADVMNMSVSSSSIRKGETLMDTAVTLNAMHPDILVVRHHASGAVELLARKVDGSVINAGDGAHEHPTQALLDALTIRRNKGRLEGLVIAICGDVMHSRVARSNILLLNTMGARVRVVAPSTLLPRGIERMGVEVARDMREGLNGADIVMMLRLQRERMNGSFVPSSGEYFHYFGLDQKKLAYAKPDIDTSEAMDVYVALLRAATSGRQSNELYIKNKDLAAGLKPTDKSYFAQMTRANVLGHRDWLALNERRMQMRLKWAAFFDDYDLLLCPAAASAAFPHDHKGERYQRTIEVNGHQVPTTDQLFWAGYMGVAFLPSTVAPIGFTREGLPVGLQIVAGHYRDRESIAFAGMLEQEYQAFVPPPGF